MIRVISRSLKDPRFYYWVPVGGGARPLPAEAGEHCKLPSGIRVALRPSGGFLALRLLMTAYTLCRKQNVGMKKSARALRDDANTARWL